MQVTWDGSEVENGAQLAAVVNRSTLPQLQVQLLDEHGLPTGGQGDEELRLGVVRSTAGQPDEELIDLCQKVGIGRDGQVRWAVALRGWAGDSTQWSECVGYAGNVYDLSGLCYEGYEGNEGYEGYEGKQLCHLCYRALLAAFTPVATVGTSSSTSQACQAVLPTSC